MIHILLIKLFLVVLTWFSVGNKLCFSVLSYFSNAVNVRLRCIISFRPKPQSMTNIDVILLMTPDLRIATLRFL